MSEITAGLVKELREKSGAGMMDCKKALVECGGNFEEAIDWLRKKGLSAAAKKSGREAAEGLIAIATNDKTAAILELNAETDFVARNDKFQSLAYRIIQLALSTQKPIEELNVTLFKDNDAKTVAEDITNHIAVIGENINLRRVSYLHVNDGIIASYVHNSVANNLGKIGVIVALESSGDKTHLSELGKKIAMHIAAARPECLDIDSVDLDKLEREKQIFIEQSRNSGKPENIIEKMVEGRIKKYYQEVVLLEQIFVIDNKTPISHVLQDAEKAMGSAVTISGFIRYELGEGIERSKTDFANEVAAMAR